VHNKVGAIDRVAGTHPNVARRDFNPANKNALQMNGGEAVKISGSRTGWVVSGDKRALR
jgi:hypothetical protein